MGIKWVPHLSAHCVGAFVAFSGDVETCVRKTDGFYVDDDIDNGSNCTEMVPQSLLWVQMIKAFLRYVCLAKLHPGGQGRIDEVVRDAR